ncbi:unnamed protein product [Calypogeia fissa]
MNFLRSGLFSDVESRTSSEVSTETGQETSDDGENEAPPPPSSGGGGWSFGSLVKSLGKVSGEVLQAYKQDLTEFADGLKKESEIVAGVTVHAVKDLPHTLETSAVVAQESLESVGQSLEEFGGSLWRGTSELIASAKEAIHKVDEETAASSKAKGSMSRELSSSHPSWKYSRYEAQVNAMQRDSSTYCDEPEDEEDYSVWRSTFNLSEKKADIEVLLKENAFMQELEARIVPLIVEYDSFWTRYFYRLHKLQQVEDARADLVKRATSSADEEELSWDVEEEAEETRHETDGSSEDVRTTEAVADEAVSDVNIEKEQTVRVVQEESSGASSPTGGRKSEQGEITTEHAGGAHDEESVSEGSTGSDWLVVQDDNPGVVDSPDKSASTLTKGKENLPAVLARRHAMEAEEPELEEIGDLIVEDAPKGKSETSTRKLVDTKPITEEPEDWGDWE